MLVDEARWIGAWIQNQSAEDVFPLCNLGSSTHRYRTASQPWIDEHVFAAPRLAGHAVLHVDRKAAEGVDLVGDLTDPAFHSVLSVQRFKTVLCSNLLEHVTDIPSVCTLLRGLVASGGFLVITGPYRYPYHLDPIDNGLRATPEDLAAYFPDMMMVAGEIIHDGTFARYLFRSSAVLAEELGDVFSVWRGRRWAAGMRRWGWLHRRFAVTAVVLRLDR